MEFIKDIYNVLGCYLGFFLSSSAFETVFILVDINMGMLCAIVKYAQYIEV
jgi:hypothetical protein